LKPATAESTKLLRRLSSGTGGYEWRTWTKMSAEFTEGGATRQPKVFAMSRLSNLSGLSAREASCKSRTLFVQAAARCFVNFFANTSGGR
jgi:hypothetical protein